jgi:predicted amidophosphoribosyltransferase
MLLQPKCILAPERAFLEMVMQQCPNCWEPMSLTAKLCPHCGHGGPTVVEPPKERRVGYLYWLSFLLMLAFAALLVREFR